MPRKFIPIISDQGIYQDQDASGVLAAYPYFLNGYFEKVGGQDSSRQLAYQKRSGVGLLVSGFANGYKIQGMVGSVARDRLILFANNGIANKTYYVDSTLTITDKGAAPAAAGNWTFTGPVVFTVLDGISYGANVVYAATDFTKGAVINATGTWTEITDADFTGLTKTTNLIGLDGYLFVGTSSNQIYNSDLNVATSWTATSHIAAADMPGNLLWLERIRNYLIAFKDRSIEFFEDVGNPTPGSPLESRKQFNRAIGCINKSTIKVVSDGIIFAGTAGPGVVKMYKISRDDLSIKEISNRFVEQCLNFGYSTLYSSDATATMASGVTQVNGGAAQSFNYFGKEFYTVTLLDPLGTTVLTQVWDNDQRMWTTWCSSLGATGVNDDRGFVPSQAALLQYASSSSVIFVDNKNSDATHPPRLLYMDPTVPTWTDVTVGGTSANNFIMGWVSDIFDFGSRSTRKFMGSLEMIYSIYSNGTPDPTATNAVTLKYRDYDYASNSSWVGVRTLNVDDNGGVRAIIRRVGSFYRRNLAITYTRATPFRLWGFEADYNERENQPVSQ